MLSTQLDQRISLFIRKEQINADGYLNITWNLQGQYWAKIDSIRSVEVKDSNKCYTYEPRFLVTMQINCISNARHAYLMQIAWNKETLEFISPFQKLPGLNLMQATARYNQKEKNDG